MIHVIFLWFGPGPGSSESKFEDHLPQVPAVGDTVHVPSVSEDGERDSFAMNVHRVSWANDQPANEGRWHAEVRLR